MTNSTKSDPQVPKFDPQVLADGWIVVNGCKLKPAPVSPAKPKRNTGIEATLRRMASDNDRIFERFGCARTVLHNWFVPLDKFDHVVTEFDQHMPTVVDWNRAAEAAGVANRLGSLLVPFRFDRTNPNQVQLLRQSLLENYQNLYLTLHHQILEQKRKPKDPLRTMRDRTRNLGALVRDDQLLAMIDEAMKEADKGAIALRASEAKGVALPQLPLRRLSSLIRYLRGDPG